MSRILSLGIANPLVRVVVWLTGCASLSLAGAAAGALGIVALALVFTSAWIGRVKS